MLCAWIVTSSILAASGVYLSERALRVLPLLCGFLVPISIVAAGLRFAPLLQSGVLGILESLPLSWLIGVQAIRITAIGTIGDHRAIEPLVRILDDLSRSAQVRAMAVIGLGMIGDLRPVPALARLSKNYNYRASVPDLDLLLFIL